jgi:probable HAF family extracellular repeat protein
MAKINDNGQIVGWSEAADGAPHAFSYSGGVMTDLGTLPGMTISEALGINDRGQVVGYSQTAGIPYRAFLYNPASLSAAAILPMLLGSD